MKIKGHLVSKGVNRDPGFSRVAEYLSLATQDLRNNAVFIIRQLLTARDAFRAYKPLRGNQFAVIALHDEAVARMNQRKIDAGESPHLVVFEAAHPRQFEDRGLMFELLMDYKAPGQTTSPYRRLPSQTAQASVQEVCKAFKGYRKATDAYWKAQKKKAAKPPKASKPIVDTKKAARKARKAEAANDTFTGKPELTGYLKKHERPGVPFPAQNILNAGRLTAIPAGHGLSQSDIDAWMAFDLPGAVAKATRGRIDGKLAMLRLEMKKTSGVRLLFIFHDEIEVDDASAAAALARYAAERKASKAEDEPDYETCFAGFARIAGLDPGVNSPFSMAFSTGHNPVKFDPRRMYRVLDRIDMRIDDRKAALTPPEALDPATDPKRAGYLCACAWGADAQLARLREKREHYNENAIHQISDSVVDLLVARGIQVLVIGRNARLKADTADGKSAVENKRAHLFRHFQFAAQVEYKARRHGIAVIRTEESYTSKASFAHSDSFDAPPNGAPRLFKGTRNGSIYRSSTARSGWKRSDADTHASYNIIRKVFSGFRWHRGLSNWFDVFWLSPKQGLAKCLLEKCARKRARAKARAVGIGVPRLTTQCLMAA